MFLSDFPLTVFRYFVIGDDGEVFKVKKSSQSKKIKKQLDKERKKKKEKTSSPPGSNNEKSKAPSLDQDIVIKLKNTFVSLSHVRIC